MTCGMKTENYRDRKK